MAQITLQHPDTLLEHTDYGLKVGKAASKSLSKQCYIDSDKIGACIAVSSSLGDLGASDSAVLLSIFLFFRNMRDPV